MLINFTIIIILIKDMPQQVLGEQDQVQGPGPPGDRQWAASGPALILGDAKRQEMAPNFLKILYLHEKIHNSPIRKNHIHQLRKENPKNLVFKNVYSNIYIIYIYLQLMSREAINH